MGGCSEPATHGTQQDSFYPPSPLPKRWTMQNVPSSIEVKTCARGRCALTATNVNNSIKLGILKVFVGGYPQLFPGTQNSSTTLCKTHGKMLLGVTPNLIKFRRYEDGLSFDDDGIRHAPNRRCPASPSLRQLTCFHPHHPQPHRFPSHLLILSLSACHRPSSLLARVS